jgi:predicted esterase
MSGTGLASSALIHPSLDAIVREQHVLYATLDRPGIAAPFGDPGAATIDEALLQRATQGHILACAHAAIRTIFERFGPAARVHLRGHSEGALIALMLYADLLENAPARAAKIETLVLTGTPLEPFETIIVRQLEVIEANGGGPVRDAVSRCDWPTMRDKLAVSCAYLEDAYARPSGSEVFEQLAAADARASIHIFHGTQDWNARVEPVQELERWLQAQTLQVSFSYYEGGHTNPPAETRAELRELLRAITSSPE